MSRTAKTAASTSVLLLSLAALFIFGMSARAPEPAPPPAVRAGEAPALPAERVYPPADTYTWQQWGLAEGLPSAKVLAVRVDGPRVWFGTNKGLALLENGKMRTFTTRDGLVHDVVVNLEVDRRTGDVWIGTAGGLSRYSGGRFESYTQFNSGLLNNMVYGVEVDGSDVWIATAAGASRLNKKTNQWSIFNETNTPMHEPWTYAVAAEGDKVFVGAWGGGVLEYTKSTDVWKEYSDPDGEMEIELFPNDGPVHDITSYLDFEAGKVWQATYFGLGVFDGTRWKGYFAEDSGLAGNFINFVNANGPVGWMGTDRGLSAFDGRTWRTFKRLPDGRGEVTICNETCAEKKVLTTPTAIAHNYVLGIDFQGADIWIATEDGVSRGTPVAAGRAL